MFLVEMFGNAAPLDGELAYRSGGWLRRNAYKTLSLLQLFLPESLSVSPVWFLALASPQKKNPPRHSRLATWRRHQHCIRHYSAEHKHSLIPEKINSPPNLQSSSIVHQLITREEPRHYGPDNAKSPWTRLVKARVKANYNHSWRRAALYRTLPMHHPPLYCYQTEGNSEETSSSVSLAYLNFSYMYGRIIYRPILSRWEN